MVVRKRSEATEQERVISWARWNETKCKELKLLHHVPNGGRRDKLEAARLKAQGVKAGVPDLCLPVPRDKFHGLYIEMKFKNNTTTENQKWWLKELKKQGYKTAVCWSAEEAINLLEKYMGIVEE